MSIDPELSIKNPEIEEQDRIAKEKLDSQRKTMEERMNTEYREHVENLLKDLQKDYVVEDVNHYEAEEYVVLLKHKETGEIKPYAFEAPLQVNLPPRNNEDPNNAAERTSVLYNYLFKISAKNNN